MAHFRLPRICGHLLEGPENIGHLKPGERIRIERGADVEAHRANPVWFIGKHCKLGFPTPEGPKEYMWVRVTGWDAKKGELSGRLQNHPVRSEYNHSDGVAFTPDEIFDVAD